MKNRAKWFELGGRSVSFDENFASQFENIFREFFNLSRRTHYDIFNNSPYEPSRLFTPGVDVGTGCFCQSD